MTALLTLLLLAAPTQVEIHYMPIGTTMKLSSGETVKYFRFEEYKLLLKLDGDLWDANDELQALDELVKKMELEGAAKDAVIKTLRDDAAIFDQRLTRMETNWKESEKRTIAASGGPVWPYVLAAGGGVLAVAGVVTILVVVLMRPTQPSAQTLSSQLNLRPL